MPDEKRWLSRKEAVEFLGVSQYYFAIMMSQGIVKGAHFAHGTRQKYDREELKKILEPQPQGAS